MEINHGIENVGSVVMVVLLGLVPRARICADDVSELILYNFHTTLTTLNTVK